MFLLHHKVTQTKSIAKKNVGKRNTRRISGIHQFQAVSFANQNKMWMFSYSDQLWKYHGNLHLKVCGVGVEVEVEGLEEEDWQMPYLKLEKEGEACEALEEYIW